MKDKKYEKALYLYNKGNIDKAIEVCESEMSKNLKNSKIINLKGVLLYLKGELEESIALWSINSDYNNDEIASSYLNDSKKDFKRKELYEEAEELIHNLSIDEAIKILTMCMESDFNTINVNNSLAKCYLKKGDYKKVKECLENVFKLDKYNTIAKELNKELGSVFKYKDKESIFSKVFLTISISIAIMLLIFIGSTINDKQDIEYSTNLQENQPNQIVINDEIDKPNDDIDKLTDDIDKTTEEKEVVINKNLTNDDIREVYIEATEYFDEGCYEQCKELLDEVIGYLNGSHLDDDIIFLLASVSDEVGDIEKAVENFDRYIADYSDGSYIVECYYKAALIYKNIDISISKNYANEILINYPDSIYNNSYIEEILSL